MNARAGAALRRRPRAAARGRASAGRGRRGRALELPHGSVRTAAAHARRDAARSPSATARRRSPRRARSSARTSACAARSPRPPWAVPGRHAATTGATPSSCAGCGRRWSTPRCCVYELLRRRRSRRTRARRTTQISARSRGCSACRPSAARGPRRVPRLVRRAAWRATRCASTPRGARDRGRRARAAGRARRRAAACG